MFPVILELGEGLVVVLADLTHVHRVLGGHQEVLDLGMEVLGRNLACKDRQIEIMESSSLTVDPKSLLSEGKLVVMSPMVSKVPVALVVYLTDLRIQYSADLFLSMKECYLTHVDRVGLRLGLALLLVELAGQELSVLSESLLSVRQSVNLFPVRPEVGVVVAVLPAHLADVDGSRQLLVVQLPLGVEEVRVDLAIRTEPRTGD